MNTADHLHLGANPVDRAYLGSERVWDKHLMARMGAAFAIDARHSLSGEQIVSNRGSFGSALDATYGASASGVTNDPTWLPHDGIDYFHFDLGTNALLAPTPSWLPSTALDIRVLYRPDAITATVNRVLVTQGNTGAAGSSFQFLQLAGGALYLSVSNGSAFTNYTSTATPPVSTTEFVAVRVTWGTSYSFWWKPASSYAELADNTGWTRFGSFSSITPPTMNTSTTPLAVGNYVTSDVPTNTGSGMNIAAVWIANTVNATTPNFAFDATDVDRDATSFTATTGDPVTIFRPTSGPKIVNVKRPVWLFSSTSGGDALTVPDHPVFNAPLGSARSVVAVARFWGTPASGQCIWAKATTNAGTTQATPRLLARFTTSSHAFYADDATAIRSVARAYTLTGTRVLAYTIDDNQTRLYDGTNFVNGIRPTNDIVNGANFAIGSLSNLTGGVDMELHAFGVFDRALSPTDLSLITTHYIN